MLLQMLHGTARMMGYAARVDVGPSLHQCIREFASLSWLNGRPPGKPTFELLGLLGQGCGFMK